MVCDAIADVGLEGMDLSFDELVRLDFYYIETWSIWLDLVILVRTVPAVLFKKGAY